MPEREYDTPVCILPLPGAVIRPTQADATLSLWDRLCAVQQHPAWLGLRAGRTDVLNELRRSMRGAKTQEAIQALRLRHVAASLPTDVLMTWGGMAIASAKQKQGGPQAPYEPSDADFKDANDAEAARAEGVALDALVKLDGWKDFALLLAAHAWALDFLIANGPEAATGFCQTAMRDVVQMLVDIQGAIDRGVDAAAWLSWQAEREQEAQ